MGDKLKVLFICVHNSARSQMAEALLKEIAGDTFEVESAGLSPGALNPLAVEAMREVGIDISQNKTKSVFDFFRQGRLFDYVITVCNAAEEEGCPTFPGVTHRWHWPFPDPSTLQGSHEEKMAQVREIREAIKARIMRPFKEEFKHQSTFND